MTARQVYEGVLIELNKVEAPSLLLEDFNYLFNKAINAFINKQYNMYDANQQITDNVRVLKSTAILDAISATDKYSTGQEISGNLSILEKIKAANALYGATYEVNLPQDYLHLLNCVCVFKVKKSFKCYNQGSYVTFAARRLTSDMWGRIINNFYMQPTYKRPYFYIHNVNTSIELPTNPLETKNQVEKIYTFVFNNRVSTETGQNEGAVLRNIMHIKVVNGNLVSITQNDRPYKGIVKFGQNDTILSQDTLSQFQSLIGIQRTKVIAVRIDNTKLQIRSYTKGTDVITNNDKYPDGYWITCDITYTETDPLEVNTSGTDMVGIYSQSNSNFPRTITIGDNEISLIEKETAHRYGNASPVRMEIRYGKDDSLFQLTSVYVDYIKTPQYIRLTQEQLDLTEDTSQMMEFPDYVCQEIINELVILVMANASDPNLQVFMPVNLTIASPTPQGQQQPGKKG